MAAGIISLKKGKSPGFFNSLSYAACEWFLIILLFVNVSLTYLTEKFAQYCELNSPCILCSRLDCVLGKAKPGGYWNLLCKNHREEISSSVSCSVHCNPVHSHGMCEGCAIHSFNPFYRIGYAELKRSSDSEMVAPHNEDDDGRNPYCREYGNKSEDASCFSRGQTETLIDNGVLDKWSHQGLQTMPSVLDQPVLVDSNDSMDIISSSADAFKECSSKNLDWAESYLVPGSCLRADMMTLNSNLKHDVGVAETSKSNASLPRMPALPLVSEPLSLISLDNMVPISQITINVFENNDKEKTFATKHTEAAVGGSFDNVCSSCSNDTVLSEPLTLSHSIQSKSISSQSVAETIFLHDSVEIIEDVSSLEPIFVARLRFSIDNNGHSSHYQHNESKDSNECRFHFVSNESSFDSLDDIRFYGAEGENTIDRLKILVENYRRCLIFLFRELEEERNAAAIAANQAMAMITRLQEQKAASHMEALHNLRILEEQAEYALEELEKATDLLAEKEEELQVLKTASELGRNSFLDEPSADDPHGDILKVPNHDMCRVEYSPCTPTNTISARVN